MNQNSGNKLLDIENDYIICHYPHDIFQNRGLYDPLSKGRVTNWVRVRQRILRAKIASQFESYLQL